MRRVWASLVLFFFASLLLCGLFLLGGRRPEAVSPLPAAEPAEPVPELAPASELPAIGLLEFLGSASSRLREFEGIDGDKPHVYTLDLRPGEYLQVDVGQRGIVDLYVELIEPGSTTPIRFDRPGGPQAAETLTFVARGEGIHKIEIRPWGKWPDEGAYGLSLVTPPQLATEQDHQRLDAASRASSTAWRLRKDAQRNKESLDQAVEAQLEAAALWAEIGDLEWEAELLWRAGRLDLDRAKRFGLRLRSDLRRAEENLQGAIKLYALTDNPGSQAVAYSDLGKLHNRLEEVERARGAFQKCAELARAIEVYEPTRASCLQDLGLANRRLGRFQDARKSYREAIESWHRQGKPCAEASARSALGNAYFRLGNQRLALEEQERALQLAESSCLKKLPTIQTKLASALERLGEDESALRYLDEAFALRRDLGDERGQAVTLQNRANVLLKTDYREAERLYRQALALFKKYGSRRDQSTCLRNLCTLYERAGSLQQAGNCYDEALAVAREAGQIHDEAAVLFGQARLAAGRSELSSARMLVEEALEIIELVREQSSPSPSSAYYLSFKQDYYGFLVAVLAELHRKDPDGGYDVQAFEMSERSRARSLLDTLSLEIDAPESAADPERRRRLEELEDETARLHTQRLPLMGYVKSEEKSSLDTELRRRLAELEETARSVSRRVAVAHPRTISLEEIQRKHLDSDTLLLEYQLGPDRSFLWAVTQDSFRLHFDLPSRETIERSVDTLRKRIRRTRGSVSGGELARMLLAPVADLLPEYPHLLIVPQGALYSTPFAFLPHPDDPQGDPLVATHRFSFVPSMAVLAALREPAAKRPEPSRTFVGLGDGVYDAEDAAKILGIPVQRPDAEYVLGRLRFSGHEIETLHRRLGGEPDALAFYDFDASRALLTEGVFEEAGILHFATHALADKEHPELSTVVLSRYSAGGEAVDGYLRAYEIARLELAAKLVVLSACETGLGTQIRGEGLVGLTQAFLQAGAPRVVASLWRVDDAATSQLMTLFYDSLVEEGLPPAEALRRAQDGLRRQKPAPFYWAGFVLQGDWR